MTSFKHEWFSISIKNIFAKSAKSTNQWQLFTFPMFYSGRLGNQLSSVATLYSFARRFGLRMLVTREQHEQLAYYFQPDTLGLVTVETALAPHMVSLPLGLRLSRVRWETPWAAIDHVDNNYNYARMEEPSLHTGRFLNMGDFPNEVELETKVAEDYAKFYNHGEGPY